MAAEEIPAADLDQAMRLLGVDTSPDRVLVALHIESGTVTAMYSKVRHGSDAGLLTAAVRAELGEYASEHDVEAIVSEVVGSYTDRAREINYQGLWAGVDFWEIATKHEIS